MTKAIVIEDSARVREILTEMVVDLGYDVTAVSCALDGVQASEAADPAVVLLDWDLPSSGALDFLAGLAESQLRVKPTTILMATENEPRTFALARAAGASHYILKPFDRSDLAAIFERAGLPVASRAA
ncbi:MAG: response regulator [Parvularcula sp.]|jgi:CheY-like chemotaxis protein|nr:response regulator [Parvularcula sp.]